MFWLGFFLGIAVAVVTPCMLLLAGELVRRLRGF